MKDRESHWVLTLLQYALLGGASAYLVVYVIVALFRIQYPFGLDWMEGGMVDHVRRILSGHKLYVRPSLQFTSFIYAPVYLYLSAALSTVFGVGFLSLRLLSFVSSLGCFFVIFHMVKQETKSSFFGLLSAGLFAATFGITGWYLDLGRVDSLFLFLLLTAIFLIRFKESAGGYVLAGVFLSLSFLTKQTALVIGLPLMLYAVAVNRRCSAFLVGTVLLVAGGGTFLLHRAHDGWYAYYVFGLPGQHPLVKEALLHFWTKDIMGYFALAFLMAIFYLLVQVSRSDRKTFLFYLLMLAGALCGSWASRLHSGGFVNVLLPAYAALSILFGLGAHSALQFAQAIPGKQAGSVAIYVHVVCAAQFACLIYNPLHAVPTQQDLRAGHKFVSTIAGLRGEVFAPAYSHLSILAGKNSYAHLMAIHDVLRGKDCPAKTKLADELHEALRNGRFSAVVLNDAHQSWFQELVEQYYAKQGHIPGTESEHWPTPTGGKLTIYVPKDRAAAGESP